MHLGLNPPVSFSVVRALLFLTALCSLPPVLSSTMALTEMEKLYGPLLLGVLLNVLLYGIMTTQTYYYFVHYKRDKTWMKCFVGLLFFTDTVNTVFDVTFLYKRLIVLTSQSPELWRADWIFNTDPAMVAIVAFFVQSFFGWRVKVLSGSIWLALLIWLCSFAQLLGGIGTAIACGIVVNFENFHRFKVVVIIWHVFAAVADVIIAASLVTHLRSHRTGFAATDDIITKITRMAVSTGAITAVWAIFDLVAFLASTSGLYLAVNFPFTKLYTNSLLSSLNARPLGAYSEHSVERSQARSFGNHARSQGDSTFGSRAVNVTVTRAVEVDSDPAIHMPKMYDVESHEMDVKN